MTMGRGNDEENARQEEPKTLPDEPLKTMPDLADTKYNYWEPEKWFPEETKVKMGSDAQLPRGYLEYEIPPELGEDMTHWNLKETTLSQATLINLIRLLNENNDVFSKHEFDVGCYTGFKHSIDTGDHPPIKMKPRPLSHEKLECLKEQLDQLLGAKLIKHSRSVWACAILFVPKPNGRWRLCVDYRPINAIAACCQYPIPRISDMLPALRGAKYFTALDLNKGFHQIALEESSKPKLAFVTPLGLFQWERTPFGIHSGPAAFQAAMRQTLAGLEHCAMVYIDDIIIFTKDVPSHLDALKQVFDRLREVDLKICPAKCEFCRTEVTYLGHIINAQGIKLDPKKIEPIVKMPPPICTLDVETFVGKTGYYQKFIKNYSAIAHPLMRLKGKNIDFAFGDKERESFEKLKKALCSAPVLRYPDFEQPFYISTDASGYGLGAVLFQKHGEQGTDELPVGYASRVLKDAELRYSATEREALAVWWACDHFIDYIDGQNVTVYSDHKALLALPQKEMGNRRLQLIAHKLMEFKYTIEYRPGIDNANADTLSRYPVVPIKGRRSREVQTNQSRTNDFDDSGKLSDPGELPRFKPKAAKLQKEELKAELKAVTLTIAPPLSLRETESHFKNIVQLQDAVPEFKAIRIYAETGALPEKPKLRPEVLRMIDSFVCEETTNALYRVLNRDLAALCIPPELHKSVLYDMHMAPCVGHLGVIKTLARLREHYWWPTIVNDVINYVKDCPLCQAHKERPRPPREKLGNRPPPTAPWQRLHMDIWGPGKESTSRMRYVLGVIDAFSKYLILIPIRDQKALTIADAMIDQVILPFGMPYEIVSDRGPNLISALQAELYSIFGITRRVSTAYRPQANGQIERMFRTLRPVLATLANRAPRNWDRYLTLAAHSQNTAFHTAIKNTPFFILMGRKPHPLPIHHGEAAMEENVHRLRRWKLAREVAGQALIEDQETSKLYYDTRRARPQAIYKVNDCVLVKTTKIPKDAVYKLYPKYVGPYRVIEVKDTVLSLIPIHELGARRRRFEIHKDRVRLCATNYPNIHTWKELARPFMDPAKLDANIETEEYEPRERKRRSKLISSRPRTRSR